MTGQRWRAPDGSRDSCLPQLHPVPCAYSWDDSFPYFPCAGHGSKMTDYLKSGKLLQANPANMATKTDGVKKILFTGYDGLTLLDLAGPMQAFEAANAIRRNGGNPPPKEISWAASRSGWLQTAVSVPVEATSWQDDAA